MSEQATLRWPQAWLDLHKWSQYLQYAQDTQQITEENHTSSVWHKDINHEGARGLYRDGQDGH